MNVLVVDQLLRDSIKYVRQRTDAPSPRNLLILIMNRDDKIEAASAAAGVVNFLGKFEGGTLGVMLLDIRHGRLYYPIDRSLQPRGHRRFQDLMRLSILNYLIIEKSAIRVLLLTIIFSCQRLAFSSRSMICFVTSLMAIRCFL